MKAIVNANIVQEDGIRCDYCIVYDRRIESVLPISQVDLSKISETLDANGKYIIPGLIDLHVHGCKAYDAMDASDEALRQISGGLAENGVTRYLATTMTMAWEDIARTFDCIRANTGKPGGAILMGAHMEGPFINSRYRGAHNAGHIILPDYDLIEPYLDVIKLITLAPETDRTGFIERIGASGGIILSMGHSAATYEQAREAVKKGITHVTHAFNAMSPLHHREPGVVGASLIEDVYIELIPDMIHIRKELFSFLLKIKGIDRITLITDSMRAAGLEKGVYDLGGSSVITDGFTARLEDGTLAGSILAMNRGVANFMKHTGLELWQAVRLASINPARELGIDSMTGSIREGKFADFAIADEDMNIYATFVEGQKVYGNI